MEHDEIDLERKQNNSREKRGRFGVNTNKTLKYDRGAYRKEKESITVIDVNNQDAYRYNSVQADLGVGISLNAHKNWEFLDKNPLRSSQDDIGVEYSRVVDLEFDPRFNKPAQREEIYRRIYGAKPKNNTENNNTSDDEPEYVSGTNRKGHFVKQKRKLGKKGVKGYADDNNSNNMDNSTDGNNKKKDKSKRRSAGSDSDSQDEPADPNEKIILIQRHKPGANIHLEQYPTPGSYRCTCDLCNGIVDKKQRRMQAQRNIDALDLSIL